MRLKIIMPVIIFSLSLAFSACENPIMAMLLEHKIITFETNGGSPVPSQSLLRSEKIAEPSAPSKDGCYFDGWYTDNDTFFKAWNFNKIPEKNMTLYAAWGYDGEDRITGVEINSVALTVTSPVKNYYPDDNAYGYGNFTIIAVSWSPDDNMFKGGKVYTVTVMLKADEGHTFKGLKTATINGNYAGIIDNKGTSVKISYTFAMTLTNEITGIWADIPLGKLTYAYKDKLDLSSLSVTLYFDNGYSEYVSFADFNSYNISVNISNGKELSRADNWFYITASIGNHSAGVGYLIVNKAEGAGVTIPVVNYSPESLSITVNPVSLLKETGQSIEYAISASSYGSPYSWQSDTTFTGLNYDTTYYVYARSADDDNYNEGTPSVSDGIYTGIPVTGVYFNQTTLTMNAGYETTLYVIVEPYNATYQNVTWSSNNKNIATVSNGVVAAVAAGTTVITVTTADGGKTAACYVTVVMPPSLSIEMVQIPAGTFIMGSPTTEPNRYSDETQHSVTLSAFSMSKYQITQEQYQAVMGSNPSYFNGSTGLEPAYGEIQGKRPVECVSWYDALVFCNKLSVLEGLTPAYSISGSTDPTAWGTVPTSSNATWNAVVIVDGSTGYRLPTEAQWEYACRAGTTTAYNTGATISDNTGWYYSNSGSKTHQVGLKPANEWGLYDMHGNVCEWCWDWYGTYPSTAQTDPMGASSGTDRVERGGSWFISAEYLRSANRHYFDPYARGSSYGFRLVRP